MIDCIPHCLICGKELEKSAHIFGNCPIAATIWSLAHIAPPDFVPGEHRGISLGLTILDRNRKKAKCILIQAKKFIEEFKAAKKESFGRKPPFQSVKFNFDTAVKNNKNYFGIGVVARDHMGYLLTAHANSLPGNLNSHYAEHYATRAAVMLARELSLQNVIFAGNSLNVIRELKENSLNLSMIGLCLLDTKRMLSTFPCVELTHIRREGNEVTHSLAQFALSSSESFLWKDCILSFFTRIFQNDCTLNSSK
ncbi:hypothetical protein AXF42_Ash016339 [Apostasia shenzhenica]|uniref:RNase H type-1 domain-containing protein n=1 Tax=Apostasia shenzhenica TaxID=1088818 RepID=A0A2H9ZXK1_9ASPA|nr:hypothetical protein AXF42_Ash016339 [Apostasia shenzhenica]